MHYIAAGHDYKLSCDLLYFHNYYWQETPTLEVSRLILQGSDVEETPDA